MAQVDLRLPGEVATELGISTSTLRRWAKEFNPYLSDVAGKSGGGVAGPTTHRRYTRADVDFLAKVKSLLDQGMTYGQVIRNLKGEARVPREEAYPIVPADTEMEATAIGPSLAVVGDALRNIGDNQQTIQNSLQVNRNLLGVLIQDNFNLKEENSKLRDRVLKLEQSVNQFRQERQASPLSEEQDRELQSRKGCLSISPQ